MNHMLPVNVVMCLAIRSSRVTRESSAFLRSSTVWILRRNALLRLSGGGVGGSGSAGACLSSCVCIDR
jgi:hypothetical protein